jgi:ferritin-like metal-binding protein YciE
MGLFSISLNSIHDLLMVQLETLYDAKRRLAEALPAMMWRAHSPDLQQALQGRLEQTERQLARLQEIFSAQGRWAQRETCAAMKGLLADALNLSSAHGDPGVKDAALIAAVQAIGHYEIASYSTAGCLARQLGHEHIASLLQTTVDEEHETDRALTAIAANIVHHQFA